MLRVQFTAYGHENVIGEHKTTIELTSEGFLTKKGTCIIGVRSDMTLDKLDREIKNLASKASTRIVLRMTVNGLTEEVKGTGSPGLTYADSTSMVVRTSTFECDRTLMVYADKAASNLNRDFIERLRVNDVEIGCELIFFMQ
jgi:hypothetical protein